MEFTKKESFMKQIAVYINKSEFEKAYELSKTFLEKFPDEMMAHFFLAKSAFWLKKYNESVKEARKALNMSDNKSAMVLAGVLAASAHYQLGEYKKGYQTLKALSETADSDSIQEGLFIFSIAMNDKKKATWHLDRIFAMNKKMAQQLLLRYLE